jgi:hypothetical protein
MGWKKPSLGGGSVDLSPLETKVTSLEGDTSSLDTRVTATERELGIDQGDVAFFDVASPSNTSTASKPQYGYRFTAKADIVIKAVKFNLYQDANCKFMVWDVEAQALIGSEVTVGGSPKNWREYILKNPIQLTSGKDYIISYDTDGYNYQYYTNTGFSNIASDIQLVHGVSGDIASEYPTNTFTSSYWISFIPVFGVIALKQTVSSLSSKVATLESQPSGDTTELESRLSTVEGKIEPEPSFTKLPNLTSNTSPYAVTGTNAGSNPYQILDGTDTTSVAFTARTTGIVEIDLGSAQKIEAAKYYIGSPLYLPQYKGAPRNVSVKGSNDKASWSTLLTVNSSGWANNYITEILPFSVVDSFRYYRLEFTESPDASFGISATIKEVELFKTDKDYLEANAVRLQNVPVDVTGLQDGYVLTYDAARGAFVARPVSN